MALLAGVALLRRGPQIAPAKGDAVRARRMRRQRRLSAYRTRTAYESVRPQGKTAAEPWRLISQSSRLEIFQQGPDGGLLFFVHLIRVEVREKDL
jgi:hypothetical protein